jgi:hypothetical protein
MTMRVCQLRCHIGLALLFAAACKGTPPPPGSTASDASTPADVQPPQASASGQAVEPALSKEAVEAFANPAHLPVYQGPTGSIEGTITVKGDPSPDTKGRDYAKCPEGESAYKKLFREGPPRADGSRALADAIVSVTGYAGVYVPETKPSRVVSIEGCALANRAIDVTIGQRLQIENKMKDKIFAPAFLQQPSPLALVASPGGEPVFLYPQSPRVYTLYDRFGAGSSYLTGEVYVFREPLHAVTDVEGHYRIDSVPVGSLKVRALLGVSNTESSTNVEVRANVVQTVDLELTYTTPPPMPSLRPPADPPHGSDKRADQRSRIDRDKIYK